MVTFRLSDEGDKKKYRSKMLMKLFIFKSILLTS